MEMIYTNNPSDADTLSIHVDQCMLGCHGYCPCLSLCYVEGVCPLCAINFDICGVDCYCAVNA